MTKRTEKTHKPQTPDVMDGYDWFPYCVLLIVCSTWFGMGGNDPYDNESWKFPYDLKQIYRQNKVRKKISSLYRQVTSII